MCYNIDCLGEQEGVFHNCNIVGIAPFWLDKRPAVCLDNIQHNQEGAMLQLHRHHLSPGTITDVLERDGYLCVYCGEIATCIDHVIPWSWSRCDELDNLVASCNDCNMMVSNMMFNDFGAKCQYIRHRRVSTKWVSRRRIKHTTCVRCEMPYLTTNKTTSMLCERCAREEYPEWTK
jgi:hypothetical protein